MTSLAGQPGLASLDGQAGGWGQPGLASLDGQAGGWMGCVFLVVLVSVVFQSFFEYLKLQLISKTIGFA